MFDGPNTTRCGVYSITNLVTGKRYIGSTSQNFKKRWRLHRSELRRGKHHSPRLQNAWNRYGEAAFEFAIVEQCDPRWCVAQEQVFIDFWKSADTNHGYNIAPTAGSARGRTATLETREKLSKLRTGRVNSPETRARISASKRGQRMTDEAKRANAIGQRGKKMSVEACAKMSAAMLGRPKSPEAIAKSAASRRGLKASDTARANNAAARRGKPLSAASIAKRSATNRGSKRSPETIDRMRATQKRLARVKREQKMTNSPSLFDMADF